MSFFPKPRRRPAPGDGDSSPADAAPRPYRPFAPRAAAGARPADRPRARREDRDGSPSPDVSPRREDDRPAGFPREQRRPGQRDGQWGGQRLGRPASGGRPAGDFPRAGRDGDRREERPRVERRNDAARDPWVDGQPRFLPMSRAEMQALGWEELDVLLVNGDAYVDHPAFGPVLLGRWLVAHGFRVGIVAQPRWQSPDDLLVMGRPRLFVGVSAGALDSMLAHYTAFRKKRHDDAYTPGGKAGARPNRACLVYANLARQAFPGLPVILGGIEASLRRTTHYDFWTDSLRRPILLDAKADLLIYGMGELAILECARRLAAGKSLHGIDGTAWLAKVDEHNVPEDLPEEWLDLPRMQLPAHEAVQADAAELLRLTRMLEQQVHRQNAWAQQMVGGRALVLAPPARPLDTGEMDRLYALPYARAAHPRYRLPIPADEMLRTSITSHRGCGGGCSFCSLALHQGRRISSRSQASILAEARQLVARSRHGQVAISDVGGPTANMWQAHCALDAATAAGAGDDARPSSRCRRSSCCYPTVCKSFITPQMQHVGLLREVAALPGVRQVRVASGVRADLALNDPEALAAYTGEFTGGQLKVAPEHCAARVLDMMRKPGMEVFEAFLQSFMEQSRLAGREQYVVPYLMSAFPGCTDEDMHELARWLQQRHWSPQQTQCFIPTPGSIATAMYYCGRNEDGEEIYVARSDADRLRQHRILMPDFGRMPERGGHDGSVAASDATPRRDFRQGREDRTERWREERRAADGLAPDDRQDAWKRPRPSARFDDEQDDAPRRDFRRSEHDGLRGPGSRQGFRQDFRPGRQSGSRPDGDGPQDRPSFRPSFHEDRQDGRPFRSRADRFMDRDKEQEGRPFKPRTERFADRDDAQGQRPFRPRPFPAAARHGDDGQPARDGFRARPFNATDDARDRQDAWKRPRPSARFDDEQDDAPRRDFRRSERDGLRRPGSRQDFRQDFRPGRQSGSRPDGDGPQDRPMFRPSFHEDRQDGRPFRSRADRFMDRDKEQEGRPFKPRTERFTDRDDAQGQRPFRPRPFPAAARHGDDGQPARDGFRARPFNATDDARDRQDAWKRPRPSARFDDEQDDAPRRDFRRSERDGLRGPGSRQGFRQDFRPGRQSGSRPDGDGPQDRPSFRPSFHEDRQDGRPFRSRADRFMDRDKEQEGRPFKPRTERFADRDDAQGQRPFRPRGERFPDRPREGGDRPFRPRGDLRRDAGGQPARKNLLRRDGRPAFGSRRRDRAFDGPALNDDEE